MNTDDLVDTEVRQTFIVYCLYSLWATQSPITFENGRVGRSERDDAGTTQNEVLSLDNCRNLTLEYTFKHHSAFWASRRQLLSFCSVVEHDLETSGDSNQ